MNTIGNPSRRLLGGDRHPDFPLTFAELAAEHTEAMRRLRFDCLLPYMYAGWTRLRGRGNWREDFPTPMAAALHSTMAPVLASLEMFDRNYVAGSTLEVPLALINETHGDVEADLDLYVTPRHPVFVPDAQALQAAVWHWSTRTRLSADSLSRMTVDVPVPEREGTYYLAAVLSRPGAAPVVSQRVIRAVDVHRTVSRLRGRRVFLVGGDEVVRAWLRQQGCQEGITDAGRIDADVALVWDAARLTDPERSLAGALRRFAEAGGRVVVADQTHWPWTALADCAIGRPSFPYRDKVTGSRAHAFDGATHPMLADIPPDWLWRWNGLPGTIADHVIMESPALDEGRRLLWVSDPRYVAALSLPVRGGEIVFCQLKVRERLSPESLRYDPVAERVLTNLLAR